MQKTRRRPDPGAGAASPDGSKAPWWRKSVSFIYDFIWLLGLLFIPFTFLSLIVHVGGFPPPWQIESDQAQNGILEVVIFIVIFVAFWVFLGLCLSPNVQTPGMALANIDLYVEGEASKLKLSIVGVFAYYGVFIPIFNMFSMGLNVKGVCRGSQGL